MASTGKGAAVSDVGPVTCLRPWVGHTLKDQLNKGPTHTFLRLKTEWHYHSLVYYGTRNGHVH